MKTRIALILSLALAITAQAQIETRNHYLIALTPGGFDESDPSTYPQAFWDFIHAQNPSLPHPLLFFDEMWGVPYEINGTTYPPGWVSQFGVLDGGTYFQAWIDRTGPVPVAVVRWNFHGSGYILDTIYVHDSESAYTSLYQVRVLNSGFRGFGTVEIDGVRTLDSLSFYGYRL
jgi:hypothetical protein